MAELQHSDLFSGKTGLTFQRNLIASLSDFGSQIAKEFEAETGIPVKCEFISRAMGAMKIRFKPLIALKTGTMDFERTMENFIKNKLDYITTYINRAVKNALGSSSLVESSATFKSSSSDSGGLWMGTGDEKQEKKKENSASNHWIGVSSG
jgi:hypothetical protein